MVLRRLQWKLGHPHEHIHAYTKARGTAHSVATLLSHVGQGTATVVFFDLEKAFELASPLAITHTLAERGIQGRLLKWILDYLQDRSCRVRFQGAVSPYYPLENGTPQGGVLSPALFNVLMEKLLGTELPPGCRIISYADDLALVVTGRGAHQRKAQTCLSRVSEQCAILGLKVSPAKSKAMRIGGRIPEYRLVLQQTELEWVHFHIYLGIWIDDRLTFKRQANYCIGRVRARVNAMKALARREVGATFSVLRMFYMFAIRTVIDYACLVNVSLSATMMKKIECLQNEAMRIMLGAPRWTLIPNMHLETRLQPLSVRMTQLVTTFVAKVVQSPQDTELRRKFVTAIRQDPLLFPQRRWLPLVTACVRGVQLSELLLFKGRDEFRRGYVPSPPWEPQLAQTRIMKLRRRTPDLQLRMETERVMAEVTPRNSVTYFTDGSVETDHDRAGAAFVTEGDKSGMRVIGTRCSMQAEAVALGMALSHALDAHNQDVVVHTDSIALIQAVTRREPGDNIYLITSILLLLQQLREQDRKIVINWVPGHIGIAGNEEADREAKRAALGPLEDGIGVWPSREEIRTRIRTHVNRRVLRDHRIRARHSNSAKWYAVATEYTRLATGWRLTRRDEVLLFRLRLGYPCAWEIVRTVPEEEKRCPYCEAPETNLRHYLQECPATLFLRGGPQTTPQGLVQRFLRILTKNKIANLQRHPPPR
ncbi:uncharacterized protein LOC143025660 [Oratosquilla oratoria]|uniref:uncharacterized protein LOC143025660 n=1 Tax=Oratosquilla oratoria TaxID=337810 RepID=UPI003F75CC9F